MWTFGRIPVELWLLHTEFHSSMYERWLLFTSMCSSCRSTVCQGEIIVSHVGGYTGYPVTPWCLWEDLPGMSWIHGWIGFKATLLVSFRHRHLNRVPEDQRKAELFNISPAGTSFQVVMSLGCDWLRTGPTSDAQVSPVLQARAPSRERHIQEAEYCLLKSMGISPGPTWDTTHHWSWSDTKCWGTGWCAGQLSR